MDGFFSQALVLLGATLVLLPLFQRLGLGSILGYLAAGIAVGPLGFGLVSGGNDVLHFAELGVVLMLFLVGLELGGSPSQFMHPRSTPGSRSSLSPAERHGVIGCGFEFIRTLSRSPRRRISLIQAFRHFALRV